MMSGVLLVAERVKFAWMVVTVSMWESKGKTDEQVVVSGRLYGGWGSPGCLKAFLACHTETPRLFVYVKCGGL
jgi:hypothetical protein